MRCRRCGTCCKDAGRFLQVTPGDLARWQRESRVDILRHILVTPRGYSNIWRNPEDGTELECCPFLHTRDGIGYECAIYETRPQPCREFFCVLCDDEALPQLGDQVVFGLSEFIVSSSPVCPDCGEPDLCQLHHFVNRRWLQGKKAS